MPDANWLLGIKHEIQNRTPSGRIVVGPIPEPPIGLRGNAMRAAWRKGYRAGLNGDPTGCCPYLVMTAAVGPNRPGYTWGFQLTDAWLEGRRAGERE